ncbi:Tetratricopeptide repeat-containing protein [Hymenobacter gelipurpurascens]|uniref:Regulator of microtubule dynamics protein 1 n=1 Tax=Hymenobacter gelipurpurascens TaxID=89968 RepID=A0A212TBG4_9BACT|nr:tetratricopeptide repeat protein [Hymenobacter gelipurpurascens]SNC63352.1 Tetratricopeptide repeat-containing protein [Hymenobacter gelipurpurascens]
MLRLFRLAVLFLSLWLPLVCLPEAAAQVSAAAEKAARPLADPVIRQLMTDAKTLQEQYHESEALAKYEQVLAKAPATYDALWQAAVLSVRIGARYTDETRKAAYFSAARLYANRALVVQPTEGEGHYAEALALSNQATLLASRGRLLAYREMKPHVFMAVARRPDWADAWQLLGRWHYRVDHYNLLERVFSRLFLGGTPSGAGTRKAIDALVRAHELAPQRIEFCYDLARVYLNQGQRSRAVAVLQEAINLTPVTAEELETSRRCRRLLEQLNRQLRRQLQRHIRLKREHN